MQAFIDFTILFFATCGILFLVSTFGFFLSKRAEALVFGFPCFYLFITATSYYISGIYFLILSGLTFIILSIYFFHSSKPRYNLTEPALTVFGVCVFSVLPFLSFGSFLFFSEGIGDVTIFAPTSYVLEESLGISITRYQDVLNGVIDSQSIAQLSPNERLVSLGWTIEHPGWFSMSYLFKSFGVPMNFSWYLINTTLICVMISALNQAVNSTQLFSRKGLKKYAINFILVVPIASYGSYIAFFNGALAQLQGQALISCYLASILVLRFELPLSWHLIFVLATVLAYYPILYVTLSLFFTSELFRLTKKRYQIA